MCYFLCLSPDYIGEVSLNCVFVVYLFLCDVLCNNAGVCNLQNVLLDFARVRVRLGSRSGSDLVFQSESCLGQKFANWTCLL